jgi:hypothetical protein
LNFVKLKTIFLLLFWALSLGLSQAQMTDRYIIQASLRLSVDQSVDFWLNGHYLKREFYTGLQGGPQPIVFYQDHLCYFQRENVLAIRVLNVNHPDIGIAYVLRLILSDGSHQIFTSDEADDHQSLYLPNDLEPYGWQQPGFDDSQWSKAYNCGHVPYAAVLLDPDGSQVSFLSASGTSPQVKKAGERHLFRFRFNLDILPNPRCATSKPTPTPMVLNDLEDFPASPTVVTTLVPKSWTATPNLSPHPITDNDRLKVAVPTFTPVLEFNGTEVHWAPTFPPTFTPEPQPSEPVNTGPVTAQSAISFNISFADGTGLYQLEVVDGAGNPIRKIFNQVVNRNQEIWLQWDGKDEAGNSVLLGNYSLVYSKDGQILRKMALSGN